MKMLPKEIIKKHHLDINYNYELKNIESQKAIFVNNVEEHFDKIVLAMPINNLKEITNINIEAENNFNKTAYVKSSKKVLNKAIMLVADDKSLTSKILSFLKFSMLLIPSFFNKISILNGPKFLKK